VALVNDLTGSAGARSRVGVRASPTALPSSGSINTSVPRDSEKARRLRHGLARATSPRPTHTACCCVPLARSIDVTQTTQLDTHNTAYKLSARAHDCPRRCPIHTLECEKRCGGHVSTPRAARQSWPRVDQATPLVRAHSGRKLPSFLPSKCLNLRSTWFQQSSHLCDEVRMDTAGRVHKASVHKQQGCCPSSRLLFSMRCKTHTCTHSAPITTLASSPQGVDAGAAWCPFECMWCMVHNVVLELHAF